jgi:DNA recombination-dependent growth factor C
LKRQKISFSVFEGIKMPKMTVSVPDELLAKFKETFPEINPAEVVRGVITRKIKELEKLEELKSKGKL